MAVMYICDQMKYCNISDLCGAKCRHTADRTHALYREHKHFVKKGDNSWEQDPEEETKDGEEME